MTMGELWRDQGLDELVRELNQAKSGAAANTTDADSGPPGGLEELALGVVAGRGELEQVASPSRSLLDMPTAGLVIAGSPLDHLLAAMVERGASDLLLVAGEPPVLRIDGRLERLPTALLDNAKIALLVEPLLGARGRRQLFDNGAVDLSARRQGVGQQGSAGHSRRGDVAGKRDRFRVNLHRQQGGLAAAIRALPATPPTLAALGLPGDLAELLTQTRGLVLVCGPTGAGKTTTLAALVAELNARRACHIITVEDPIEYEHRNRLALVEQIEVGRDTPSFAVALRNALRQDPDVLLVGEMRDPETISAALTAAETGHLVLSTLHTNDSVQAIHRIVDVFPAAQQNQVRQQLALALLAIVSQQLVPRIDGGRVVAVEVLLATHAVRHQIRSEQLQKLYNEVTLGKRQGMISLEASLARLVRSGEISRQEATIRSTRPDELESLLRAG